MMNFNRSLLALAAATMTFAPVAFAGTLKNIKTELTNSIPPVVKAEPDQTKPSLGFWGGYAQTESRRDATVFGADYTYQPVIPFSVGGEVLGMVIHRGNRAGTLTRTMLMAKANYNFGGDILILKNTYLGLALGPVFDNETETLDVSLGIQPNLGMDFMLPSWFTNWSLGVNFGYTFMTLTTADSSFTANGVLKYWF